MATAPRQAESRGIVIGMKQLEQLRKGVVELAEKGKGRELAGMIGHQQEEAARRRIRETKQTPGGKKWQKWSKNYAKTREPHHSLLVDTGALADSLTHYVVNPLEVQVGSNLIYAAAHLYGDDDLPQRAYLDTDGSFADSRDREEIRDIVRELFELRLL